MTLHNPLFLIILPIFYAVYYFFLRKRVKPSVLFSDTYWFGASGSTDFSLRSGEYLLLAVFTLVVIGLARPQKGYEKEIIEKRGIDIVLVMDISGSMKAADFEPNRLSVAKDLASDFIGGREGDRIGLVCYAREGLIQAPLTLDHELVKRQIQGLDFNLLPDGTAIGMGISYANLLLSESSSENRVIILLTDGRNNAGKVDPETASDESADLGIKIYTVGIGKRGKVPFPVRTAFGTTTYIQQDFEINEDVLRRIADRTGGEYFRATSGEALEEIYDRIDRMEKTTFEVNKIAKYRERLEWVLLPALFLLLVYFIEPVITRKIP